LRDRDQWICWRYEWYDDRNVWTKVPVDPATGEVASVTDPDTCGTFEDAVAYHERADTDSDGLGFVFDEDGSVVGLDLDDCRDPDTGELDAWAADLLADVETFTEVSPSGTGLHLFGLGSVPDGGNRGDIPDAEGHIEMYESGRYFTVTGARVEDTPATVEQVSDEIADVHAEYIADDEPDANPPKAAGDGGVQATSPGSKPRVDADNLGSSNLPDDELVERAKNAKNGDKFRRLWNGDTSGYPSHSEADLAFCNILRFWTDGDRRQIDRLFRQSGLYREKWDRDDYRKRTIDKALIGSTDSDNPSETAGSKQPPRPDNRGENSGSRNSTDSGTSVALTPAEVIAHAGVSESKTVADLSDRQKAASVWAIISQHEDIHVRVQPDNDSLWACNDGIWEPEGERKLRHAAREALGGNNYGQNVLAELKTQARADPCAEVDADEFGLPPGTIAVENGLVDLEAAAAGAGADALRPLEPEDYALAQLPVEYDPDADAGEWTEFVGEVVELKKIQAVQEYVGYTLHRGGMPFSKALLLVGSGSNGKTTFLNVVRELLGTDYTTTKPVHKFDEDNHVADLYGALANIDTDLSKGSLSSAGIAAFKRLVGGDSIDARKLYEDAFSFNPTAKHLYACNQVPDVSTYVSDHDIAFWRRWIVVEFPSYFSPDARDPDLEDRLTTDETLSGILNWAIEGWGRLHENGGFTNVESHDDTRQLWQSWGESVEQFIAECVQNDPDADRITTGQAYRRYQAWCRENDVNAVGRRRFTDTLKQEDVDFGKHRINGTSQNGYTELGLSDDVPDVDDSDDDAAGS